MIHIVAVLSLQLAGEKSRFLIGLDNSIGTKMSAKHYYYHLSGYGFWEMRSHFFDIRNTADRLPDQTQISIHAVTSFGSQPPRDTHTTPNEIFLSSDLVVLHTENTSFRTTPTTCVRVRASLLPVCRLTSHGFIRYAEAHRRQRR